MIPRSSLLRHVFTALVVCATGGAAMGGMAFGHAAHAQQVTEGEAGAGLPGSTDPAARRTALHRVAGACRSDVPRFCPELSATASPREQAICLKYFKSDLSLGCRGAINAASR